MLRGDEFDPQRIMAETFFPDGALGLTAPAMDGFVKSRGFTTNHQQHYPITSGRLSKIGR